MRLRRQSSPLRLEIKMPKHPGRWSDFSVKGITVYAPHNTPLEPLETYTTGISQTNPWHNLPARRAEWVVLKQLGLALRGLGRAVVLACNGWASRLARAGVRDGWSCTGVQRLGVGDWDGMQRAGARAKVGVGMAEAGHHHVETVGMENDIPNIELLGMVLMAGRWVALALTVRVPMLVAGDGVDG